MAYLSSSPKVTSGFLFTHLAARPLFGVGVVGGVVFVLVVLVVVGPFSLLKKLKKTMDCFR